MTDLALPDCSIPLSETVTTGEQWRRQHPTWLLGALRAGTVTEHAGADRGTRYAVAVHHLGELPLPDGRVIGCDPYLAALDLAPFDLLLPAGDHPVAVGVVSIGADHVRPTALLLVTGAGPIVRWSLARHLDDDSAAGPEDDAPGMITGYGVDAGTGAFLSPLALPALVEVGAADGGMLEDPLSEAMEASPVDAALLPPRPGALAVAQCASGWGDGVYATWVGWDAADAVSLVMTDFSVIGDPWSPDDDRDDEPDEPEPDDDASPAPRPASEPAGDSAPGSTPGSAPRKGLLGRLFGR